MKRRNRYSRTNRHTWAWRRRLTLMVSVSALALASCATTTPYTGVGPHPQLSRGHAIPPLDAVGNVFGLPAKLILWNWRVDRHSIDPATEAALVGYLERQPHDAARDAKYRLNEYAPHDDWKRLVKNRHVGWPYRATFGVLSTLLETLIPGRLVGSLLLGDHYNPYTNTVHIYSDHPAILLHEAGHVTDIMGQSHPGTYAMARILPGMDLVQEYLATDTAIDHYFATADRPGELAAYKILYPAYGTYLGAYLPVIGGSAIGALGGHIAGRTTAARRAAFYRSMEVASHAP